MPKPLNILSLFDGVSIAKQAFYEIGYSNINYFASEIDKYAISVSKYRNPDIIHIGDVKDVGYSNGYLTAGYGERFALRHQNNSNPTADTNLIQGWPEYDIDLMIGGSPCFIAGTMITCKDNIYKNIEDVKVGDYVLTHLGKFKKVLRVGRSIEKKELWIVEYTQPIFTGLSKEKGFGRKRELICTGNHRFYVQDIESIDQKEVGYWEEIQNVNPKTTYLIAFENDKTPTINDRLSYECREIISIEKNLEQLQINAEIQPCVDYVYNLEVENDNSYCANSLIVHNCQDLSISKQNRQGLAGSKSSLFYEYLRILKETKPKYFILENVASMKREDMETITRELFNVRVEDNWNNITNDKEWSKITNYKPHSKYSFLFTKAKTLDNAEVSKEEQLRNRQLGNDQIKFQLLIQKLYTFKEVGCTMINASLVSAQSRKRLFWVGKWNDETGWYDWVDIPQPEDSNIYLKDILLPMSQIDDKYILSDRELIYMNADTTKEVPDNRRELHFEGVIGSKDIVGNGKLLSRNVPQGQRVYNPNGKACTIRANGGGDGAHTGLYKIDSFDLEPYMYKEVRTDLGKLIRQQSVKLGRDTTPRNKNTKEIIPNHSQKVNCITTSTTKESWLCQNSIVRKLHPIETERLQSLPDNFTEFGLVDGKVVNISNTQRFKMMGNGFNCKVIQHILQYLKNHQEL